MDTLGTSWHPSQYVRMDDDVILELMALNWKATNHQMVSQKAFLKT